MKVLHLITGLEIGGAEIMLLRLVKQLQERDVENQVVSMTTFGPIGQELLRLGVPVEALGIPRGRFSPSALFRLKRILRTQQPDILQTWLYHADLLGSLTRLTGSHVPVVWGVHHTADAPHLLKPMTRLVIQLNKILSPVAPDKIICCSQSAYDSHIAFGYPRGKMKKINNGIDPTEMGKNPESYTILRMQLGLPTDTLLIGHCGRFVPGKGHQHFIQAAQQIHQSWPEVHFLMCGRQVTADNPQLDEWIHAAGLHTQMHLIGERPDLAQILAGLDIYVSSSLSEALPLTLAEAMACQVPCVATDVGDQGALMGDTGRLVPPGSAESLATACIQLLEAGPQERERLGKISRQRVIEHYSITASAEQYLRLYQQVKKK